MLDLMSELYISCKSTLVMITSPLESTLIWKEKNTYIILIIKGG